MYDLSETGTVLTQCKQSLLTIYTLAAPSYVTQVTDLASPNPSPLTYVMPQYSLDPSGCTGTIKYTVTVNDSIAL